MDVSEMGKVLYSAVLSSPGMNDQVKLDFSKVSRKTVLLLVQVIQKGLTSKSGVGEYGMIDVVSNEELKDLLQLSLDILERAGLTDLSNQLSVINQK